MTRLISTTEKTVTVERQVILAMYQGLYWKTVTLPRIEMHVKALEAKA